MAVGVFERRGRDVCAIHVVLCLGRAAIQRSSS